MEALAEQKTLNNTIRRSDRICIDMNKNMSNNTNNAPERQSQFDPAGHRRPPDNVLETGDYQWALPRDSKRDCNPPHAIYPKMATW